MTIMVILIKTASDRPAKLKKLNLLNLIPLNYDRDGETNPSRS